MCLVRRTVSDVSGINGDSSWNIVEGRELVRLTGNVLAESDSTRIFIWKFEIKNLK